MNKLVNIPTSSLNRLKVFIGKAIILLLFAFLFAGSPKSIFPLFGQPESSPLVENSISTDHAMNYDTLNK